MNDALLGGIRQHLEHRRHFVDWRDVYASELSYGRYRGPAPESALRAGVMILLFPDSTTDDTRSVNRWHAPLTLRPEHLPVHGGQISLPGGAVEGEETSRQAAFRELEEELGVDARDVHYLGELSDIYVFASNYLVTPYVGVVERRPTWRPQQTEVAEVIELPLEHLIESTNTGQKKREKQGIVFQSPCITFGHHEIWGATSMILGEFIGVVREAAGLPLTISGQTEDH